MRESAATILARIQSTSHATRASGRAACCFATGSISSTAANSALSSETCAPTPPSRFAASDVASSSAAMKAAAAAIRRKRVSHLPLRVGAAGLFAWRAARHRRHTFAAAEVRRPSLEAVEHDRFDDALWEKPRVDPTQIRFEPPRDDSDIIGDQEVDARLPQRLAQRRAGCRRGTAPAAARDPRRSPCAISEYEGKPRKPPDRRCRRYPSVTRNRLRAGGRQSRLPT